MDFSMIRSVEKFIFGVRYVLKRTTHKFKAIGWPVGFEAGVQIIHPGHISLGNFVYLGKNVKLQISPEYWKKGEDYKIVIGNKVTVGQNSIINAIKAITIGNNTLIGPNVYIADHGHAYRDPIQPIRFQGIDKILPVVIKENCWIGANCVINSGVQIGKNSVIGANSVVTHNIPDYSVAVGSPARIIKQYNETTKQWEKQ